MKFITITKENFPLVAHRIIQFIKRHGVVESYSDWGWYPKMCNKMGIKWGHDNDMGFVERTITSYVIGDRMTWRFTDDKKTFLVHPNKVSAFDFILGQKIRITPTQIIVKGIHFPLGKSFTEYITPSVVPVDDILAKFQEDEYYDEMYWKDYEKELEEEMFKL